MDAIIAHTTTTTLWNSCAANKRCYVNLWGTVTTATQELYPKSGLFSRPFSLAALWFWFEWKLRRVVKHGEELRPSTEAVSHRTLILLNGHSQSSFKCARKTHFLIDNFWSDGVSAFGLWVFKMWIFFFCYIEKTTEMKWMGIAYRTLTQHIW